MYDPAQLMASVAGAKDLNPPYIGPGNHRLAFCYLQQKQTDKGLAVFLVAAVISSDYHPVGTLVTGRFPLADSKFIQKELARIKACTGAILGTTDEGRINSEGTQMLAGASHGRGLQFKAQGIDTNANKPGKNPFIVPSFAPCEPEVNTAENVAKVSAWIDSIPGSVKDLNAGMQLPPAPAPLAAAPPMLQQPAPQAPMMQQTVAAPPMLQQPAPQAMPPMLQQATAAAPAAAPQPGAGLPFSVG